jgi:rhodanese-related sulfurtransferase
MQFQIHRTAVENSGGGVVWVEASGHGRWTPHGKPLSQSHAHATDALFFHLQHPIDAVAPKDSLAPSSMKKLTLFLCALALSPVLAMAEEKFPDISHDELKQAIADKKVTLIDVNGSDSYQAGHIPGAINFETDKDALAAKLPKDKNALVVAYCGNEQCGAYVAGAKKAKELGYTNVKHYAKGIMGCKKSGDKT